MLFLVLRRLVSLIITLFAASLIIFAVVSIVPGDPARFMLGLNATPETVAALRQELGLGGPWYARYGDWVGGLLRGDFGTSFTYRVPVGPLIAERLAVSLPLTVYALVLSIAVAIPLGAYAAARQGRFADAGVMGAMQLGIAVPNFWLAILLVLLFSTVLDIIPPGGFPGWRNGLLPAIGALTLPAAALALPQAAILTRVMRSALIETLGEDYVRTGRAKGLTRGQVVWRHALRNALIPVLTILGLQFSFLLAGGIIIENIFFLPGLGRLVFQAITQRDLIVVQTVLMMLVFAVVMVNFMVDLAYAAIDPRLRQGARRS